MTAIAAQLDEMGKPAWIGLMILSFILFWPAGLAMLVFLIGSGRMGCWNNERRLQRYEDKMDRIRSKMSRWGQGFGGTPGFASHAGTSSGNRAFDEYKADTLRRLEEEQQEFRDFLDRLRFAKDKSEFDDFLAQRRNRPPAPDNGPATDVMPA